MTKPRIIGRMRFRLRGPQTIKMKVSRTFTTQYSDRPPVDPRKRWDLLDARLLTKSGEEFTYGQLMDHFTDAIFDEEGNHDNDAVALIQALIEMILMSPKKSIRLSFTRVCQMAGPGTYGYTTINNVFEAAKSLAVLVGKKGPTWDDFMLAQGIEEAVPAKMKKDVDLSAYWETLAPAPSPASEPAEGLPDEFPLDDELEVVESRDGLRIQYQRPRQRRVR